MYEILAEHLLKGVVRVTSSLGSPFKNNILLLLDTIFIVMKRIHYHGKR